VDKLALLIFVAANWIAPVWLIARSKRATPVRRRAWALGAILTVLRPAVIMHTLRMTSPAASPLVLLQILSVYFGPWAVYLLFKLRTAAKRLRAPAVRENQTPLSPSISEILPVRIMRWSVNMITAAIVLVAWLYFVITVCLVVFRVTGVLATDLPIRPLLVFQGACIAILALCFAARALVGRENDFAFLRRRRAPAATR
jgi:hypothetical protein